MTEMVSIKRQTRRIFIDMPCEDHFCSDCEKLEQILNKNEYYCHNVHKIFSSSKRVKELEEENKALKDHVDALRTHVSRLSDGLQMHIDIAENK